MSVLPPPPLCDNVRGGESIARSNATGTRVDGSPRASWIDRLARQSLLRALPLLRYGRLELVDATGLSSDNKPSTFGDANVMDAVRLRVVHPRFFRRALLGGVIGVAESYVDGDWRTDQLTDLVRLFIRNRSLLGKLESAAAWLQPLLRLGHWLQRNTVSGSRRNISAHYDLGNEFFELFLDETMAYSSGIFSHEHSTLKEASVEKFDRLCRKLHLAPSDHLLEIGTGWGGLAIHAAQHYGCRVTTTTISREQYHEAQRRIRAAGLEHRITLLLEDYRKLTGQYDKLVSCEMIEAVGHEYLPVYFRRCGELLKPHGLMALQAITIADALYDRYRASVDFIQKYIFPGGCLPCVSRMASIAARHGDLRMTNLEDFPHHYAETLSRWDAALKARRDDAIAMGYSERFLRLWEFYFAYCEGGFREEQIGLAQLVFSKPDCRLGTIAIGE